MADIVWLYFSLNGRLSRNGYWLFYILPAIAIGLGTHWLGDILEAHDVIEPIVLYGFLWPSIAIQVKRWHDLNKTGWWVLVNLIPIVGALGAFVANGIMKGSPSENSYGSSLRY